MLANSESVSRPALHPRPLKRSRAVASAPFSALDHGSPRSVARELSPNSFFNSDQAISRGPLVDKVADVGQDALAQFHTQKTGADAGAQILFKALQYGSGQIRLLAK